MLVPVAPIAPRAILPDDPGVALRLATSLLGDDRLMANHHRGLWGYTGSGRDGLGPLTIQSTGIGAASASLVLDQLAAEGLTVAVRVGTAQSHSGDPAAGMLYAVSRADGDGGSAALDEPLTAALAIGTAGCGAVRSMPHDQETRGGETGVTDLETAGMARTAQRSGMRLAAVVAIGATATEHLDHQTLAQALHDAGVIAGDALASC